MVEDDNYGLDSDESGRYVEHCLVAEMSKVVLSEKRRMILGADRVTTMRVCVTAAAKRAVGVKEGDLLANADAQANPDIASKAHNTELKTLFDN
eukprot:2324414-Pyramimonas_sp.AAC.1